MKWLNRFEWHSPFENTSWFVVCMMLFLWSIAFSFPAICGLWWSVYPALLMITLMNVSILCVDRKGTISRPWSLMVGTVVESPTIVSSIETCLDEDRFAAEFIRENFAPRNYCYVNSFKVMFRRKQDAVMFKLACGGKLAD